LLNYGSGLVKDAIDNVFLESTFTDSKPVTGIIKDKKKIIFFETEDTAMLKY
jgi:hypothetical protein